MIQDAKKCFKGGRSDAERAVSVLDEFCEMNNGNVAEFVIDKETNVVQVIAFQSARQKRLFAAFPEVVLVDSTHNSNANRYKLFSFAVHDVFGKVGNCFQALTKNALNICLIFCVLFLGSIRATRIGADKREAELGSSCRGIQKAQP
ncbi:hypothetical protein PF011_g27099 [Phytophthora fragariae]|uniref:ZSWIM1/3 RNaseH-like domain-containing protein n=1 Tax=Phytophthora fragariae TaxID=53985 RepID=A0A6A3HGS1_9STRA|nr:hypothetical protein PF011_g27099 [Phytophthora fragariae]